MSKKWLKAARLRTLPLASSSVLAAAALANSFGENWNILIFVLALSTAISLQVLSNFANDLGDHQKGTDNENRVGPKRSVQSGEISISSMKKAVFVTAVISFFLGTVLLWVALGNRKYFLEVIVLLCIGLLAIGAAVKYTMGKSAYGYKGLGDLAVFTFFGLVAVCGTYFLLDPDPNSILQTLPTAIMIGAFSTAVLNLNNLRDHENDRSVNKKTLVVFLGFERGKIYHLILICVAAVTMVYSALLVPSPLGLVCFLGIIPLFVHLRKVMLCSLPKLLDSELKKVALLCFAVSLILFTASFL